MLLPCSHAAVPLICRCPAHMLLFFLHAAVPLLCCGPAACFCTAPAPVLLINGCLTLEPAKLMWCSLAHAAVLLYLLLPCSYALALLTFYCPAHMLLPCLPAAVLLTCRRHAHTLLSRSCTAVLLTYSVLLTYRCPALMLRSCSHVSVLLLHQSFLSAAV